MQLQFSERRRQVCVINRQSPMFGLVKGTLGTQESYWYMESRNIMRRVWFASLTLAGWELFADPKSFATLSTDVGKERSNLL